MTQSGFHSYNDEVSHDWMAWVVLRHFLPTDLQRQVASQIVRESTGGRVELDGLIAELSITAPLWNDSWVFVERRSEDRVGAYLRRVVSNIAWQNDSLGGWSEASNTAEPKEAIQPKTVEALLELAQCDLSISHQRLTAIESHLEGAQVSLRAFLRAFHVTLGQLEAAPEHSAFWMPVEAELASLSAGLRFASVKHLADLCADRDRWHEAAQGYLRAQSQLEAFTSSAEVASAWRSILDHSRASAARVLTGPQDALAILSEQAPDGSLGAQPLEVMNGALDLHVSESLASGRGYASHDKRTRVMRSPLLLVSHSSEHAVSHWLQGHLADAERAWWALLRRQVALGSHVEAASTRAYFARTLLDDVLQNIKDHDGSEQFESAVNLLITSGHPKAVGAISWSPELVGRYVSEAVVATSIECAATYDGARREREQVLIELFERWVQAIPPRAEVLATRMWTHLAFLARTREVHLEGFRDVARPAFESLARLASHRPELLSLVAGDVALAVREKLDVERESRLSHTAALEVAIKYIGAMSPDAGRELIDTTLTLLRSIDPEAGFFPVVRPALRFLVSRGATALLKQDSTLAERVLDAILRFGTAPEGEQAQLLYYLHDFDRTLLTDLRLRSTLASAIDDIRIKSLATGHSTVCTAIDSLLIAPSLVGRDALLDAITGLVKVLGSATGKHSAIGLAHAYEPLLDLCSKAEEIEKEISDIELWRSMLALLAESIAALWDAALRSPALLAPFALPAPTRAHGTIVHNWAFATRQFVERFGYEDMLGSRLLEAAMTAELGAHVLQADATRAINSKDLTVPPLPTDDPDAFYGALGSWLVRLEQLEGLQGDDLCRQLFGQVLRFGPREIDAAVLLAAHRRGLVREFSTDRLSEYATRLRAKPQLTSVLRPIVGLLQNGD